MSIDIATLGVESPLDILLARQPVFDKNQEVQAYQLLFRNEEGTLPSDIDDLKASSEVILNAYTSIATANGLKNVPCYVKVTEQVLLSGLVQILPRDQYCIEILPHAKVSPQVYAVLESLADAGYRLVLAGYKPFDDKFESLLSLVHVVKVDIQMEMDISLADLVRLLRPYHLELLAEKVETQEEFRNCMELGFQLFQGYFLSRPEQVRGRKLSGNKLLLVQLLVELDRPDATSDSIEQIVINDPVLTYRFLRVVNSASFNLRREVTSLSHAITLLGFKQIKKWVCLFMVADGGDQPQELIRVMLTRGRMCELLAEMGGYDEPINYFIVGLLSQLDALLGIEMEILLSQVPLGTDVKKALLNREGQLGDVLQDAEKFERAEWDQLNLKMPKEFYEVAYRHSLNWSTQVMLSLNGDS